MRHDPRDQWWLTLALRSFPNRWRRQHGEEFLATANALRVDGLAAGAGREVLLTVWAGLMFRLRTRPPLGRWLAFRFAGSRLPEPWQEWMSDEVDSPFTGVRYMAAILWPVIAVLGWEKPWRPESGWDDEAWMVVALFYLLLFTAGAPLLNRLRRRRFPH